MGKGQNKRQIGKGMKPRGSKGVKPQKEPKEMPQQTTTEGQPEAATEAVLEPQQGNETPGNLEPENSENSFQNLENSSEVVAHDEGLAAALDASGGTEGGAIEAPDPLPAGDHHAVGEDEGKPQPPFGGMAISGGVQMAPAIIYEATSGKEGVARVGLQPDGSTKVVVTIAEGYWEAVQQWAEADGVPVERWLSDRLYEYLSTYGQPAQGR